jgi:hypothetical protein
MFTDREKVALALIAGIALAFVARHVLASTNQDSDKSFLFQTK